MQRKLDGFNDNLENQMKRLHAILKENKVIYDILRKASQLDLEDYYIGAGCICQSVWNHQNGNDLMYGISDVDIVYYDNKDLSYEAEDRVIQKCNDLYQSIKVAIDAKNQARVHLWYEQRFGKSIPAYQSVEDAINTWPTTASAVGVKLEKDELVVYAPFGLNDMFGQIIRANKRLITQGTYDLKCNKWKSKWTSLEVIEW